MDKRIYICAAFILIIASLGLLAYKYLELKPDVKPIYPSREAYKNEFLALERWLKKTGFNVRYDNIFIPSDLEKTNEKVIVTLSSLGVWINTDTILPWIEKGGSLVIFLDSNYRDGLDNFLFSFGIIIRQDNSIITSVQTGDSYVDMGGEIYFISDGKEDMFIIKQSDNKIRLVEIPVKMGTLTITGIPYFMYNNYINKDINASLSWRLTGERADKETGVLIITDTHTQVPKKSISAAILKRGNLFPVGVSVCLLVIIGFWMVIPGFGLVFSDKQRYSRPIEDRFMAEINFLKKYRALDYYLDVYKNKKSEKKEKYNYRELINQYRSIFYGTKI